MGDDGGTAAAGDYRQGAGQADWLQQKSDADAGTVRRGRYDAGRRYVNFRKMNGLRINNNNRAQGPER